ncbi:MAG: class I SAM-dependent methyltransferase [Pseudomonadota bacterium]
MTHKLGLPLEYKKLPQYFDAHNICDDTDLKNSVVEKLLKKHKVKTVLDLTCGTGSQVFFLAKRGYKVVGADFSPALLEIARGKAKKEKMSLKFIDGDMRTIKVGSFDAAITMFNAVGHLTKSGFEKAMRNIHGNLKDGGIYVFDIFNLEAMNDKVVSDFSIHSHRIVGDTQIHNVQCSTIDRKNGFLTSYDNCTIQKNADKPVRINNKFSLQIYTAKELRDMLARNGFKTLDHFGIDGSKFLEKKSTSILTVAKKVNK